MPFADVNKEKEEQRAGAMKIAPKEGCCA